MIFIRIEAHVVAKLLKKIRMSQKSWLMDPKRKYKLPTWGGVSMLALW